MTSISTVKLNEIKRFDGANRGPGLYSLASEKFGNQKTQGNNLLHAFGTNESRKMDNRTADVIDNPAPNEYVIKKGSLSVREKDRTSAVFLSKPRKPNLNHDVDNPGPTAYNT